MRKTMACCTMFVVALSTCRAEWPMAGANPQRTSWVAEEVRGMLKPVWIKPFEPYISMKVQVAAADGLVFVASSRGLYAIDAETGDEKWVYPTELPLGHSPCVADGAAYVGCFDRRIHAVDAKTGRGIWASEPAGAGFHTSPLVVEGRVYAGNRDGVFYCLDAKTGAVVWKFATEMLQPILFSAAYSDGTIYFAANDMHAYALDAKSGGLKWKSDKLPGVGFHSWWPVIAGDLLALPGAPVYRTQAASSGNAPSPGGGAEDLQDLDCHAVFPEHQVESPKEPLPLYFGEVTGEFADTARILEYHAQKPWRRTMFILDRHTGRELMYDFDETGKLYYMPALWWGTHGGPRYPPAAAPDGCLYFPHLFVGSRYIPRGHVFGWKPGERQLRIVSCAPTLACDEPVACAGGGNLVYWMLTACRSAGAIDVSIPCARDWNQARSTLSSDPPSHGNRQWRYFNYSLPGSLRSSQVVQFGGNDGAYGEYGDLNPPVPYNGRVYFIMGGNANAVVAFAPDVKGDVRRLDAAETVDAPLPAPEKTAAAQAPENDPLRKRLCSEIEIVIDAGHLRPGWFSSGLMDWHANWGLIGAAKDGMGYVLDYWHDPVDTIAALGRAAPFLPEELRERARQYLKELVERYPPWQYSHIGWKDGASREAFDLPPDIESERGKYDAEFYSMNRKSFRLFYGLWKYAELCGGAKELFEAHKYRLEKPPSAEVLRRYAFLLNACIADRIGYLRLEQMAGAPESVAVRGDLERLVGLRFETLDKTVVILNKPGSQYEKHANNFRNFLYMAPELAERIRANVPPEFDEEELEDIEMTFELDITAAEAKGDHQQAERLKADRKSALDRYRRSRMPAAEKVGDIVETHTRLTPYWFVVKAEESSGEGTFRPYHDRHGIFQAKAKILGAPRAELEQYLDVPACPRGDLYYIENLCAALESGEEDEKLRR